MPLKFAGLNNSKFCLAAKKPYFTCVKAACTTGLSNTPPSPSSHMVRDIFEERKERDTSEMEKLDKGAGEWRVVESTAFDSR